MHVALLQLTSGDDPAMNLSQTLDLLHQAADQGAQLIASPEVTNILSPSRKRLAAVLRSEDHDETLAALRDAARQRGIWLLVGSLALLGDDAAGDDRFVNRSFLIGPDGTVAARYDKIHMFDVDISESESYRESAAYRPGDRAVLAQGPQPIGMTICYDLRFPHLYRSLAHAGAHILSIPAAFNPTTGAAHWETLLRARAIETGCFVLAPAQCGTHPAAHSPDRTARQSHGHSLIIDPWGKVLADGGTAPGLITAELDLRAIDRARSRIPSLTHDRDFTAP
ncbi:carbon-nitrogen hydrolase family protein [Paracoccus tegillarcae]|uniref:Amidohydrolase n=1 Tax=Paracoccus tegillarcae TaxID=1529068 RepID=A0A2K9ELM5_9RHOB|nr:carbon-nitrogen hydrolase family protein [Paracoccus tegillarcae]AUH35349.1 amidohydrolase [Paracoccus tegillarcae]